MIMCNAQRVVCHDEPTENYHQTLQLLSALQSPSQLMRFGFPAYFTVIVQFVSPLHITCTSTADPHAFIQ